MSSLAFGPKPRIKSVNRLIGGHCFTIYIVTPRDVEVAARHFLAAYDAEQELRPKSDARHDPRFRWVVQDAVCHRWSQLMEERCRSGRALARVIGYRPHWWRVDDRLVRYSYQLPRHNHIVVHSLEEPLPPVGGVPA